MRIKRSKELYQRAQKSIPGGVNSPVRAFKSVGGDPLFIEKGAGSKMYDVDGNEYIDYIGSWGPHLFGHNPPFIVEALEKALKNGASFGAPTELEIEQAELVRELVPSVELVRMVNSGTEATTAAVRVARGFTGREKIVKFEGCYHGAGDPFLIKAGSGALTFGVPTSPGVTKASAADTLIADFNDLDSAAKLFDEHSGSIAAVIVEPIAGNMGVVPAKKEFLLGLRDLCDKGSSLLIFDEVMTGFRVSAGGAQSLYGIKPDLTTFGKIIGGGLPVGAYGGREDVMKSVSPVGPVYQAGTLSGNPLAMAAGVAALRHIKDNPSIYEDLEQKSEYLERKMAEVLLNLDESLAMNRVGSMLCLFFTERIVESYEDAVSSDVELYAKYFRAMLERGVYLAPAQFEAMFVSTAHSREDIDFTVKAFGESMNEIL